MFTSFLPDVRETSSSFVSCLNLYPALNYPKANNLVFIMSTISVHPLHNKKQH